MSLGTDKLGQVATILLTVEQQLAKAASLVGEALWLDTSAGANTVPDPSELATGIVTFSEGIPGHGYQIDDTFTINGGSTFAGGYVTSVSPIDGDGTATATITVSGGAITGAVPASTGTTYTVGQALAVAGGTGGVLIVNSINEIGSITSLNISVAGTGYSAGTEALTAVGGDGTATVAITESGGVILSVTPAVAGNRYYVGQILSVAGGTGGLVQVATIGNSGNVLTWTVLEGGTGYSATTQAVTAVIGAVTGFNLTAFGHGYSVTNNVATTATSGSGTGLTINVLSISGIGWAALQTNIMTQRAAIITLAGTVQYTNEV